MVRERARSQRSDSSHFLSTKTPTIINSCCSSPSLGEGLVDPYPMLRCAAGAALLAALIVPLALARSSAQVTSAPTPRDPHRVSPWAWEPWMSMRSRGVI